MKNNSQRLRQLLRRFKKDKNVIKIIDWEWKDWEGNIHLEETEDIISFMKDFTWYETSTYKNENRYDIERLIQSEYIKHFCIGSSDCICYNYYIENDFKMIKIDNDNYILKSKIHDIKIHRLTKEEFDKYCK